MTNSSRGRLTPSQRDADEGCALLMLGCLFMLFVIVVLVIILLVKLIGNV